MSEALHDPGGKVRIKLSDVTVGDAEFTECGRYRLWLSRSFTDMAATKPALWIGMNPSTASAEVDDPTVKRECNFTRAWGLSALIKTNVMDYRATHPKMLLEEGVVPRSDKNLPVIREMASHAELVILAFGALYPKLRRYGEDVVCALRCDGRKLQCLALTQDGMPRHTLYIAKDTKLIPYPA